MSAPAVCSVAPHRLLIPHLEKQRASLLGVALSEWTVVAPLATAGLLCLLLVPALEGWLCWFALTPLALAMRSSSAPRRTVASAFVGGLALHLCGMSWMLACNAEEGRVGPYVAQWFQIGCCGGVLFVGAFAIGRLAARRTRAPLCVVLSATWVTFEGLRHATGALISGTPYPWMKLGFHVAGNHGFAQAADLGGEYLLTFAAAACSGALADLIGIARRRPLRLGAAIWLPACCLMIMPAMWGYGHWRLAQSAGDDGPRVCLMGGVDLPPLVSPERIALAAARSDAPGARFDFLLWPELTWHRTIVDAADSESADMSIPKTDFAGDALLLQSAKHALTSTARSLGAAIMIGCQRTEWCDTEAATYNSLACAGPSDGYLGCYDKVYLVPGAEATGRDSETPTYRRGSAPRIFELSMSTGDYHVGSAICYDVCFAAHFRRQHGRERDDVDFFVQSGAEGHDRSGTISSYLCRYAKLRAIENRRAIVRNATFGYSGVIDSNGQRLTSTSEDMLLDPVAAGAVPIDRRGSLYRRFGDWPAFAGGLVVALLVIGSIKPRR
ncbi:hypothetical protein OAS39_07565 [Pirellulales bacterium]|nr:hypothetical protein [Pirellulales bacterium]